MKLEHLKQHSVILAALFGATMWFLFKILLATLFGTDHLFGRVLLHPINLLIAAAFAACIELLFHHRSQAWCEDEWGWFLDDDNPNSRVRPQRMMQVVHRAGEAELGPEATQGLLQAEYRLIRDELESSYLTIDYLLIAMQSCGFAGTLLGFGGAMGAIHDGIDAALGHLATAFDTTLVAVVFGLIACWFYHHVKAYEQRVLEEACWRLNKQVLDVSVTQSLFAAFSKEEDK